MENVPKHNFWRHVKGRNPDLANPPQRLDRFHRRLAGGGSAKCHHRIHVRIVFKCRLHLGLQLGRTVGRGQHGHVAAKAFGKARAALGKRHIVHFPVHADALGAAHGCQLFTGSLAGVKLVLADMQKRAEFMEMTGMPAATARWIDGPSASPSGIETTSPSGS